MTDKPILQQFDKVELVTTKRVTYLSDMPGKSTSPHGIWHVVGFVDSEALLSKENTLIRIPINDIKKASNYDLEAVIDMVRNVRNGEKS